MTKPKLLDLFCGAGGATIGYRRAGFDVVGVDIAPQPNYPGTFIRTDAMTVDLSGYDAIHASPPCQAYSTLASCTDAVWPKLVEPIRERLIAAGVPYVIENVVGAPLIHPIMLCGTMFPGLRVLRHRLFECSFPIIQPEHSTPHPLVFTHDKRKNHYGMLDQDVSFVQVTGGGNCTIRNARDAMGLAYMTKAEINEAIPPAYAEYVGSFLASTVAVRLYNK